MIPQIHPRLLERNAVIHRKKITDYPHEMITRVDVLMVSIYAHEHPTVEFHCVPMDDYSSWLFRRIYDLRNFIEWHDKYNYWRKLHG